jgi:hypothetical protein
MAEAIDRSRIQEIGEIYMADLSKMTAKPEERQQAAVIVLLSSIADSLRKISNNS